MNDTNVIYIVERAACDGWSCTGVTERKIMRSFQTKEEAENWIAKQPTNDDVYNTGWHRWDYKYRVKPCGFGADSAEDEEDDDE